MHRDDDGNCIVPIEILPNITEKIRGRINQVNRSLTEHTCVRLWPRTNQVPYIKIGNFGGCNSHVGRSRSDGYQKLSLMGACTPFVVVMHEIMHALGFYHEQQRPDRDNYVAVNMNNVKESKLKAYQKLDVSIDSFGSPFDLDSVMLYRPYQYAVDKSIPTLVNKTDGLPLRNNKHWTKEDIRQINAMYECENKHKFCRSLPEIVGDAEIQQANGMTLNVPEYKRTFNHGEFVRVIKCPKWHSPLNNVTKAVCSDGKFSHEVIGCTKDRFCTKEDFPLVIGNGKIRVKKGQNLFATGSVIGVSCHYKFSVSGPSTATCTENGFDVESFVCKQDPPSCNDSIRSCKKLQSEGKCNTDLVTRKKCRKTCGLCTHV